MARRHTPHSSCRPGKRVRIKLWTGEVFIAKFKHQENDVCYFFDHEPIKKGDLRSFTIYKPNHRDLEREARNED